MYCSICIVVVQDSENVVSFSQTKNVFHFQATKESFSIPLSTWTDMAEREKTSRLPALRMHSQSDQISLDEVKCG